MIGPAPSPWNFAPRIQPGFGGAGTPLEQQQIDALSNHPDYGVQAFLNDPAIKQLMAATPMPTMEQAPDASGLAPQGFLERLAEAAPGILQSLQGAHYRNFGEGLVGGLLGGATQGLAQRGAQTLGQRQSAYQTQADAATQRNKLALDAWQQAEKSRLDALHQALAKGYEMRNAQANSPDLIPTPAGLAAEYAKAGIKLKPSYKPEQIDAMSKARPYPGGPYALVPGVGVVPASMVYQQGQENARKRMPAATQPVGDYSNLVGTTRGGHSFVDVSELSGDKKTDAVLWAAAHGLPAAGASEITDLRDAESAFRNMDSLQSQLEGMLPSDPQQRLTGYGGRRLSQLLQTSPQRAAFNAWRTAAIRNLRATAGSKGLRINQAEIALAVKNDIPSMNDTYDTAVQKMDNVRTMLSNAEAPILIKNWKPATAPPTTAPSATPRLDWLRQNATPHK